VKKLFYLLSSFFLIWKI